MEYRPHDDNGMRSNNLLKDHDAASASDDAKNDTDDSDDDLTSLLLVLNSTHGNHINTSNENCTTDNNNNTTGNTTSSTTTNNDDHDHDHAYNRHTRHIEDAVIREEQCIEVLQSYLSTLGDSSTKTTTSATTTAAAAAATLPIVHQTTTPSATQQDCNRDHLRDIFQLILPRTTTTHTNSKISTTSSTNDTTLPPLHQQPLRSTTHPSALVRNFCLTSVKYRNQTNRDKVSHHKYTLRGYFTVNPSVQLSIGIVTTNHHHPIDTHPPVETTSTNGTTTTTTKCTLFHGHSDTSTAEKEKWCHWLQQQILPVVQETCGDEYPCSFLLVDHHDTRDDDDDDDNSGSCSNRHHHHHHHQRRKCTITSDSPYFLSAYITCIHEYLQFDHSRRTFLKQPSTHHNHSINGKNNATDCRCGAINDDDNNNNYRPCTMTHLPDHQSTLICIPIYPQQQQQSEYSQQTAKVEPYQRYKRYVIMDDDDDDDNDGNRNNVSHPTNRPESPCRILSLICSWKFKDRKCSLRLQNPVTHDYHHTTSSRNGGIGNHNGDSTKRLRQSDLDQLVVFCRNNVWQTLTLLRNYCSACTCWKDAIFPLPRTLPSKSVRPKQLKIHHSLPTLTPTKKRKRLRHNDHMNRHDIDADADDEGDWEDYDEGMGEDDNYDSDILKKDNRRFIGSDRRWKRTTLKQQQQQQQPQQQGYESTIDQQSVNVFDEQPEENLESSFRLSPSGRQRSDYEVERLMRIKRNERKLSQLGLLIPNHLPQRGGGGGGDGPIAKVTKRKRRSRSRKISVPLSPYRPPPAHQNYFSEPRIYPKRQGNNDDLRLPLNSWMLSSTPSLQPRRKLPIARPKQSQHSNMPTSKAMAPTPNGYQRSMDHPTCLLPKFPPIAGDADSMSAIQYRRPRGVAPGGYKWHRSLGLWVPIDDPMYDRGHFSNGIKDSKQNADTPSEEPDVSSSQNTAAKIDDIKMNDSFPRNSVSTEPMTFKGFRVIEDVCLLPKKPLKLNGDGVTYRRPHGKAPAGYDWDLIRGIWTPIGDSIPVLSKTPKVSDNHRSDDADLLDVDQSKIKEVIDSIHTNRGVLRPTKTFKGFQVLSDGCLQPKKELKLDKDNSSYRRPQGASPEGFDWDAIRGVWAPNNGATAPKVKDFVANDVVVRESGPSTTVDGVNFNRDLIETYSGFLVLSDGCLLPKKELTLVKDGTSYRRPHGASPAGFDWDPIKGVWKPIDEHAPLPNKKTTSNPTRAMTAAGDNSTSSDSNKIRLERLLRNGFVVDGDGSILPKKGLATDPANPLLYKRPRGASPGKYKWNPTRGVWEPTDMQLKKQTDSNHSTVRETLKSGDVQRDAAPGREPGAPLQKISKRSKRKNTWKGFRVLGDNCLAPKKEPKPETNRYNNKQILWRRPHGAAPSGYDWNNIRGVWVPIITVTAVGNDASELIVQEATGTATTACLPKGEELSKKDETKQNTSDNQIEAIVTFDYYYPKRKRIRLDRYTPPS